MTRKNKKRDGEARLIEQAPWLVRVRDGKRELLIRETEIRAAFRDWAVIQHRTDTNQFLITEAGHRRVKRKVRGVDLGRVFAFTLPEDKNGGWSVPAD